jgi:predicted O-linked N-acetylglucosamine transferase (SPINDLY family)
MAQEAERACRNSLHLVGDKGASANHFAHLGNSLLRQGRSGEALSAYQRAITLDPQFRTNYLLALQYAEGVEADEIAKEHRAFGDFVEGEMLRGQAKFEHERARAGKVRVGFVSGDFRNHSVAYYIEPLLANYDRTKFEITLYYSMAHEDAISQRLAKQADHWVNVASLDDRKFAQRVYDDRIDILIDLSGHTGRNRLVAFAYKPAPMQVTWLGHPNTTGLRTIDYRITDAVCDPQGMDYRYSEKLLRLPEVFCCYRPMIRRPEARESAEYAVKPTPALRKGHITFGTCNNLAKLTDQVVRVWSRVLKEVPTATLLIEAPGLRQPELQAQLLARFSAQGIGRERLRLLNRDASQQYLVYNEIDIALDPFPANGGTTTCDLLWMGVPLVTLQTDAFVGRMGSTFLIGCGHPEWIAHSDEDYVAIARRLAGDIPALDHIRQQLRSQFEHSPAMRETPFANAFFDALARSYDALLIQSRKPKRKVS